MYGKTPATFSGKRHDCHHLQPGYDSSATLIQCQQLGYRVPDDVSIIGFDNLPIAAYTSPPLTTIRQDRIELGKSGFFALSSLLNHISISTFLLHAQLIERKSVGEVSVK